MLLVLCCHLFFSQPVACFVGKSVTLAFFNASQNVALGKE